MRHCVIHSRSWRLQPSVRLPFNPPTARLSPPPSRRGSATPRLEHETYTLKNGLKVILSEDKRLPMVAVNLWYHVGPADETPGRTGFAHLFEHMMFQGSKHVAADTHFKLLEGGRRLRHQRHDRFRSHELLRDGPVEPAGACAVDRVRPHGLSARRARPEGAREPDRRRPQRAASERREPALRRR